MLLSMSSVAEGTQEHALECNGFPQKRESILHELGLMKPSSHASPTVQKQKTSHNVPVAIFLEGCTL